MNTRQAEFLVEADELMQQLEASVRELRDTIGVIRQWALQGQTVADVERRQSNLVAKIQSTANELGRTLKLESHYRSDSISNGVKR